MYLPASGALASADMLTQHATHPPSSCYRITLISLADEGAHPLPFPWAITITSPSPHEPITLQVFFRQLYGALARPVNNTEYSMLSEPHKQDTLTAANRRRSIHARTHVPGSPTAAGYDGLVRSDLLGDYIFFAGIDLLRDGSLVLKVTRNA